MRLAAIFATSLLDRSSARSSGYVDLQRMTADGNQIPIDRQTAIYALIRVATDLPLTVMKPDERKKLKEVGTVSS